MKILSLFNHPQVVSNHNWWDTIDFHSIFFPTMGINGVHQLSVNQYSSKYLLLCSTGERNSYRFEATWGWV